MEVGGSDCSYLEDRGQGSCYSKDFRLYSIGKKVTMGTKTTYRPAFRSK